MIAIKFHYQNKYRWRTICLVKLNENGEAAYIYVTGSFNAQVTPNVFADNTVIIK